MYFSDIQHHNEQVSTLLLTINFILYCRCWGEAFRLNFRFLSLLTPVTKGLTATGLLYTMERMIVSLSMMEDRTLVQAALESVILQTIHHIFGNFYAEAMSLELQHDQQADQPAYVGHARGHTPGSTGSTRTELVTCGRLGWWQRAPV